MTALHEEVPRHALVRKDLLWRISSGELQPGDQVPTEPQLIDRFKVSRTTVRRALRDLETMGLISRQPGRGSFVTEPKVEARLDRLTGFVEDMDAAGLRASASVELIETVPADELVATHLQLPVGQPVVHIQRVRLANGVPLSFDDSYLPEELGRRLTTENLAEETSFYNIFERRYGLVLSGGTYVVSATLAGPEVAGLLAIEPGAPVLLVRRTSFSKPHGAPILFEHQHFNGERLSYRVSLER